MSRRKEKFDQETGRFKRGLVQIVILVVIGSASFLAAKYLFDNEYLTYNQIYGAGFPREVPEIALFIGVALGILLVAELLYFMVYVWVRPSGRRKAGIAYVPEDRQNQYSDW